MTHEREGNRHEAKPPSPRARGIQAIVAYKLTKAVVQGLLAVVLAVLTTLGLAAHLDGFASTLRSDFTGAWSLALARAILSAASHLHLVLFALAFDAFVSSIEGLALYRGYTFAPWLVVVTTSSLLPFEAAHLVHAVSVPRVALLVVNLAIVIYLARQARRHPSP